MGDVSVFTSVGTMSSIVLAHLLRKVGWVVGDVSVFTSVGTMRRVMGGKAKKLRTL